MDGIEAATKIGALNTGTPIVAVTANIMASELEKYKKNGMPDCLGKPFTSQDLWRVLLKYLTPVSSCAVNKNDARTQDELRKKLRVNFVKQNQNMYSDIAGAVAAGDKKLAHRLAHSLKGNAGMIGETKLLAAASAVENLLKDMVNTDNTGGGVSAFEDAMNLLQIEYTSVLEELKPLLNVKPAEVTEKLNIEQASAVFEKLEPLLENLDSGCLRLLDDIRAIAGTEELVRRIEDYDFESAAKTLAELKKSGGGGK